MRLNIHDAEAADLLQQLDFRFTPTFILFDQSGSEVWRTTGSIMPEDARQQAAQLQ